MFDFDLYNPILVLSLDNCVIYFTVGQVYNKHSVFHNPMKILSFLFTRLRARLTHVFLMSNFLRRNFADYVSLARNLKVNKAFYFNINTFYSIFELTYSRNNIICDN